MKNINKVGEPIIKGTASICNWSLEFTFRDKNQTSKFVELLMLEHIDYNYTYESDRNDNQYSITLHEMSWSHNLSRIAELLETVDYNQGE